METKACYTQRNYFRNLIKSNRNQIVFTMHRLIWNNKWTSVLIQINLKMVDTFWFGFEYNKISKIFLCVWRNLDQTYSCPRDWPNYEPPGTSRALRGYRVFEGFKGGPRGVLNGGACRTSDEILPVCTQKKPKRHVLNNLFNCSKLTHNNFFFVKNVFVEINFAKKKHDKYVNLLWLQYCLTIVCHCRDNKRRCNITPLGRIKLLLFVTWGHTGIYFQRNISNTLFIIILLIIISSNPSVPCCH